MYSEEEGERLEYIPGETKATVLVWSLKRARGDDDDERGTEPCTLSQKTRKIFVWWCWCGS